ncbi:MAG TPA: CoA-acylating methylmalonate-semialdehyde dehydrogenase [Candidatus Hydrogenedentes bacterium]|nr:CoA-acylating methylmalonate-semialdehyde dehydrogenase [Candidatus Hydrogenedentota bacterium]HPG67010.1 CoA-acylating methylmalonate-semialdehyde dehydrogenase [Candidatus Hydrogenedentota bacterium]
MDSCKEFIGGEWVSALASETFPVTNSCTGEVIAQTPLSGVADVNRAVAAAKAAFPAWADKPIVARTQVMFRYKQLLEAHADEIASILVHEHGKTHGEAVGELRRGIEVVELSCSLPMVYKGETLANVGGGVDYETHRFPLGVCAAISPFNFPAMIPLWSTPLAITCGNTFILKPSHQVPLTATRLVELMAEAGLPAGVLNLVHGARDAAEALLTHPDVRAVSFVGSTAVAESVYKTGTGHGKRVQAAGGAKNHLVVMPDAVLEPTVDAIRTSAFGCSGERCMAVATVIAVGDVGDTLVAALVERAQALKVGRTDVDPAVEMGPLISQEHLDRIRGFIESGAAEGATLALDGRTKSIENAGRGFFIGPTIFDHVTPEMRIGREEIFGPVLCVMRADTLGDAIDRLNRSPYGNAASLFTQDGQAERLFRREARCGMIGINVGVPAPTPFFPFTGWNRSFFGDLHLQGLEGMAFFTQQKVEMKRWFESAKFAVNKDRSGWV